MLKQDFVPVAIDQWYQRRQKDAEGDFYRKIAGQGPRSDFNATTQGRYICTPDGTLLGYNNNRGPEKIRKLMQEALEKFDPASVDGVESIKADKLEFDVTPPADGLILRVHSKVLDGYEKPKLDWEMAFQSAIGRDNCWLTSSEKAELAQCIESDGEVPAKLAKRIARYHLIDNTRGEPPRWSENEIKSIELKIKDGIVRGQVHLETADGKRGYRAEFLGKAEASGNEVSRFDLVAKGDFWGEGQYTGGAPKGKFPLAVAFRIGDGSDPADKILPHGAKGWIAGYYE